MATRQKAGILIVTIWLTSAATLFAESSPSQTIPPKAALNAGQASVQIDLGNLYLKERNFKEADTAYIRALRSEDSTVRERALMALEKSLHEDHNYVSDQIGFADTRPHHLATPPAKNRGVTLRQGMSVAGGL